MTANFETIDSPIGPVPDHWDLIPLIDLCSKIGTGATPRGGAKVYLDDRIEHALVRSQHVHDRHFDSDGLAFISERHASELSNAEIKSKDILLNITGDGVTFGRACIIPDEILPACVNQHVSIIRVDDKKCSSGFLISFLTHPLAKSYIESFNSGGSRRAITKGNIESFLVPCPPIEEQRAIASILGSLDDKIELNRRMNTTLESMARAIFKSWFVNFDPVKINAGQMPNPGFDPMILELFPSTFRESELGVIPEGWIETTVGDTFKLTMGLSPPGSSYNEDGEGMPFYQGRRDFGFRFPERRVYCTEPKRLAKHGDTLVTVRAPVGDLNMANEECCVGRGVAAVRHNSESRSYTYYAMHTLTEQFNNYEGEGTVFGSINKKNFDALKIVEPSPEAIEVFDNLVGDIDSKVESLESESVSLSSLRDSLLPQLLSGELAVDEFIEVEQ